MTQTLHMQVQESFTKDTAIENFRRILTEDEQEALDILLRAVRGRNLIFSGLSHMSPFETLLLMIAVQQNQRLEGLEVCLKRMTERVLELYAERAVSS